jgi:hypothetical protein
VVNPSPRTKDLVGVQSRIRCCSPTVSGECLDGKHVAEAVGPSRQFTVGVIETPSSRRLLPLAVAVAQRVVSGGALLVWVDNADDGDATAMVPQLLSHLTASRRGVAKRVRLMTVIHPTTDFTHVVSHRHCFLTPIGDGTFRGSTIVTPSTTTTAHGLGWLFHVE